MKNNVKYLFLLIISLFIWFCSCSENSTDSQSKVADIWIAYNNFTPLLITVPVGTTVRWTNFDNVESDNDIHTVESGTPANPTSIFNFTFRAQNDTKQFTFNNAGTFPYFCSKHGNSGKIIVQ